MTQSPAIDNSPSWTDWRWQQRNAIHTAEHLTSLMPGLRRSAVRQATAHVNTRLTPYLVGLLDGGAPADRLRSDPIWRQFAPVSETDEGRPDRYDGTTENWEGTSEIVPGTWLHHKYPDRAVVRMVAACASYCAFCIQALRVLDRARPKRDMRSDLWQATLDAIATRPAIRDVILSGGEPLLIENQQLDAMLAELRAIRHVETIRVHTRMLTFNPFRVDDGLARVLRDHDVTEVGLHVAHPRELTPEFRAAVGRLLDGRVLVQSHTPLLLGVNDDAGTLQQLFRGLYQLHVRPYYLLHCAPHVPAVSRFRTSVRRGVEIVRELKRRMTNPAMPEYIIVHNSGKQTVPAEQNGTSEFVYGTRADGWPIVRFLNWRGEWADYLDAPSQLGAHPDASSGAR